MPDFHDISFLVLRLPLDKDAVLPEPRLYGHDGLITVQLDYDALPVRAAESRGFALYPIPRAQGQIRQITDSRASTDP